MRRTVLHITPALFGHAGAYGGAERYSFELARHMARVADTTLISFGDQPSRFTTGDGLTVQVLGPAWRARATFQSVPLRHRPRRRGGRCGTLPPAPHARGGTRRNVGPHFWARVFASDLGGGGWGFSSYLKTDQWFHGHLHISQYSLRTAA